MSLLDTYRAGQEVLGDGVGDFIPWLGIVGKVAGGALGGKDDKGGDKPAAAKASDVAAQVKQALEDDRRRREDEQRKAQQEKIEADVRSLRTILVVLGIGGAGIATWALLKK